jgi:hypothetical protein
LRVRFGPCCSYDPQYNLTPAEGAAFDVTAMLANNADVVVA